MHGHDGLGALGHEFFGGLDADAMIVEVHVGEPRNRASLHDGKLLAMNV